MSAIISTACIENLGALLSPSAGQFLHIKLKNSVLSDVIGSSTPKDNQLEITSDVVSHFNDWEILMDSSCLKLAAEQGVKYIVLDSTFNSSMASHANAYSIKLLAISELTRSKFENKIFFDHLLKRHKIPSPESLIVQSSDDDISAIKTPFIAQNSVGAGGEGTYLVQSKTTFLSLLHNKKLVLPCLVRTFQLGIPLGITVLFDSNSCILSGLRAQCVRFDSDTGSLDYFGLQWIPTKFFTPPERQSIEKTIVNAIDALRIEGLSGILNFDFILTPQGSVKILECNPRHSGATPQLCQTTELFHGHDFMEEYMHFLKEGCISFHSPFIPQTDFSGSMIDPDVFLNDLLEGTTKKNDFNAGVYDISSAAILISQALKDFKKDKVLLYPSCLVGQTLSKSRGLGAIYTNEACFVIKNHTLEFTAFGNKVFAFSKEAVL